VQAVDAGNGQQRKDQASRSNGIVEATRREAAQTWLAESALAIEEIGYLLGYSDAAPANQPAREWRTRSPYLT
jgi:hypothetical protein